MNGVCITIRVLFTNGTERDYPIHPGGDWRWADRPDRIVVRPNGADGNARHEIPLGNVMSVMVVGMRPAVWDHERTAA